MTTAAFSSYGIGKFFCRVAHGGTVYSDNVLFIAITF